MVAKFKLIVSGLITLSLTTGTTYAAAPFSPDNQPLGYIGAVELDTTTLEQGAHAYRGWYENGAWQGDLIEYTVTHTGSMSTSIDLTGLQPKQSESGNGENWSAHVGFASQGDLYWHEDRKILLGTGNGQKAFRWGQLSKAEKELIDPVAESKNAPTSVILNFLRGDQSNEYPEGALRQRFSILGDIIHSNPEYVAAPNNSIADSGYVGFTNNNSNRTPTVYVGANDGMLHAFNANDGSELWAYVPSMVIGNLSRLAGRPYAHTYFVDGGITVMDARFDGAWHTVLAGSLGAGGKGMFLLDVTSPNLSTEYANSGSDKKVLWEIDNSDKDIGFIFGETTIAKLNDGRWYAINGNGVSSENGKAVLLLIDLESGNVKKISTESGGSRSPNGLSAPALVDVDRNGTADVAYAGDIDGDMWKFDLWDESSSAWNVAYKLFDGDSSQPITVAPDVGGHPTDGHLVLFGTGRLYTVEDVTDTSTQSLYGIQDNDEDPGNGNRLTRTLSPDTDYISGEFAETVRTYNTAATLDWTIYNGWQIDLPAGERMITAPILRGGRIKATITNPDGYSNWLIEATYDQGAYEQNTIYDLNRNGALEDTDQVDNNGNGELGDREDIPMAWQRETGTMSQVTVARIGRGYDTLFLNYLNPPLVQGADQSQGCVGDCEGGLEGGHFDVSTDTKWALGTESHHHLYDDHYDTTYIDWVEPASTGLKNIPETLSNKDQQFIVLVANGDLSPGITITVGKINYNIVEYQEMLHRKLAKWDGVDDNKLKDDNGNSLIFTKSDLDKGATVRFTMNSRAIINGGLHPTGNGCVNQDENVTNDRWRNGSPVVQIVDRALFASGKGKAIDKLHVQKPIDLVESMVLSNGKTVILKDDINSNGVIEADAPDYEAYGGLVTKDEKGFLYEGLIHWHFGGNSCYGSPEWLIDLADELGSIPLELYQSMLEQYGFGTVEDLLAYLETLEACKNMKKGCKDTYQEMMALYEIGELVGSTPTSTGGGVGGTLPGVDDLTGAPVVIEGGISEGGLTSGPNFTTGRRTWADLVEN